MSLRRIPQQVDIEELLNEWKRNIFLAFNCHAVAKIEEFDASNQTVKASLLYPQTHFVLEQGTKYRDELIDYPILVDVPVVVFKGGAVSLKMPVSVGDECIILFNDKSIDMWFNSGEKKKLDSYRSHSISDGIALIGISSLAKSLEGYEDGRAVLGDTTARLSVGSGLAALVAGGAAVSVGGKVNMSGGGTSLKSILNDLVTAIKAADSNGGTTSLTTSGTENKIDNLLS